MVSDFNINNWDIHDNSLFGISKKEKEKLVSKEEVEELIRKKLMNEKGKAKSTKKLMGRKNE